MTRRHRAIPKTLWRLRSIPFAPLRIATVLPVLLVSDCRVSPWTETPEHRVQRHVPRGGASLMPPVLGLSRRLGRREGARAPVFLLMRHCVHPCARRMPQTMETIASDTMQGLMRYAWPGNIREL